MGDFVDVLAKGSLVIISDGNEGDFAVGVVMSVGTGVDFREGLDVGLGVILVEDRGEDIWEDCCGDDKSAADSDLSESVGKVVFDTSKPDGVLKKTLDSSIISSLNWSPKVELDDGLKRTYAWYREINNKDWEIYELWNKKYWIKNWKSSKAK